MEAWSLRILETEVDRFLDIKRMEGLWGLVLESGESSAMILLNSGKGKWR